MLLLGSSGQLTHLPLPALKMLRFDSPNYVFKVELSDENRFLMTRTVLNPNECQISLFYRFDQEGLVSPMGSDADKHNWETAKYVAAGSPLPLFARTIESTLKKERFFVDLCRQGDWTRKNGLRDILDALNTLDWDPAYLELWQAKSASPSFLSFASAEPVKLENMNLELVNGALFASDEDSELDFSLPLVDKNDFVDHLFGVVEDAIKESLRALYALNAKARDPNLLPEVPPIVAQLASNAMPFVSGFFELALERPQVDSTKGIDMMTLKLDIDHITNMMASELLSRQELFEKSARIHENHHRRFIPMMSNKLFILSQMIWEVQDTDPYRQVNHLLEPRVVELVSLLKDPRTSPDQFRVRFAEVFMVYYSQIVSGFDSIGQPSPYTAFVTQYMTDIFNRIKLEMENLGGLETRAKTRLMSQVQGALIRAHSLLKSSEPILLPSLPRLVNSAELVADRLLREYRAASEPERKRFVESVHLLAKLDSQSRKVKKIKFEPFALATKMKVLF